jgi:hypothetical protein
MVPTRASTSRLLSPEWKDEQKISSFHLEEQSLPVEKKRMQQAATPLCSPSLPFSKYPLVPPLPARLSPALLPPSPLQLLPFKPPRNYLPAILSPLHRTCTRRHSLSLATQETVETSKSESEFVEVGYISNVHGLQGEISVKPTTDFPELRFSKVTETIFSPFGFLFFVHIMYCFIVILII